MTNQTDQDTNTASSVGDQNSRDTAKSPYPDDQHTPEDSVRRLMDSESGKQGSAQAVPECADAQKTAKNPKPGNSVITRWVMVPRRAMEKVIERTRNAVRSYRPKPRHMALLLLAGLAYFQPWLIPILALIGSAIVIISYLTLGHDRSGEMVANGFRWLKRRNPQGADKLRSNAVAVSKRLTLWMGRLPDSWTSGLYLPNFEAADEATQKLADDPFDRLTLESQNQ